MEAHRRLELVDTLLQEVATKRQALENALDAPATQNALPHRHTLQAELEWWNKAEQGLFIIQSAFEQIQQSERQRGALARGAGR
jgi:hypothetical protein